MIGLVAVILIGIAIFDFEFYKENELIITDLLRYGFAFGIMGLAIYGSQSLIRQFCDSAEAFYLVWGILCAIVSIAFIMLVINYLPITLDEYYIRTIPVLEVSDLAKLSCHTFLYHYNDGGGWDGMPRVTIDGYGFSGDLIQKRYEECKGR